MWCGWTLALLLGLAILFRGRVSEETGKGRFLSTACTISVIVLSYLVLSAISALPGRGRVSLLYDFSDWWRYRGFFTVSALVGACMILGFTRQRFTLRHLLSTPMTSAWIFLIGFLLAGQSAGKIYEYSVALGFASATGIEHIAAGTYDVVEANAGGEFRGPTVIVWSPNQWDEAVLSDGREVQGIEVPVSSYLFPAVKKAQQVEVVFPPLSYRPMLTLDARLRLGNAAKALYFLAFVSAVALLTFRRGGVPSERRDAKRPGPHHR